MFRHISRWFGPGILFFRFILFLIAIPATALFFRRFKVVGKPVTRGPVLILFNHPYDFIDVLSCGFAAGRADTRFVGKSTLFDNPLISWIMKNDLKVIPVNRKIDGRIGLQAARQNQASLSEAAEVLRRGRSVIIAPEGRSIAQRQLLELRSGAARIAFMAGEADGFSNEIFLQTASLNYNDLKRPYGASVTVVLSEPIPLSTWTKRYQQNNRSAVQGLTEQLSHSLRENLAEFPNESAEAVEDLSYFVAELTGESDDLLNLRTTASLVAALQAQDRSTLEKLRSSAAAYLNRCEELRLNPLEEQRPHSSFLLAILLAPLVFTAKALHVVPAFISRRLRNRWMSAAPESKGFYAYLIGTLSYLGWYAALGIGGIVAALSGLCAWWWPVLLVLTSALLGLVSHRTYRTVRLSWLEAWAESNWHDHQPSEKFRAHRDAGGELLAALAPYLQPRQGAKSLESTTLN